jgi:hypothetical protein
MKPFRIALIVWSFSMWGCLFNSNSGHNHPSSNCVERSGTTTPAFQKDQATVRVHFTHVSGKSPLVFDTALYLSPVGNHFSIEKLQYYVSGFRFLGMDGDTVFRSDSVFYVDARDSTTWTHILTGMPLSHIHSYVFTFGLAHNQNLSGYLPRNIENLNMAWPDPMGGGYHFMKLEGRLTDSLSRPSGFYVHIGNIDSSSGFQANHFVYTEEKFPIHATLVEGVFLELGVEMDIASWFTGAQPYDLERYAQGVMGDRTAQNILRKNGENGVFRTRKAILSDASCP